MDFYTHEDPEQAAGTVPVERVGTHVIAAARMLSTVWRVAGSNHLVFEWRDGANLPEQYGNWAGVWLLGLALYPCETNGPIYEGASWAASYGGNYDWLWRYAAALLWRYNHRPKLKGQHPCTALLYALELPPPSLWHTAGMYSDYKDLQ